MYLPTELHTIIGSYLNTFEDLDTYVSELNLKLNYLWMVQSRFPKYYAINLKNYNPKIIYIDLLYYYDRRHYLVTMEYLLLENILKYHIDFHYEDIITYDSIKLFNKYIHTNIPGGDILRTMSNMLINYFEYECFDVVNYICKYYEVKWDNIIDNLNGDNHTNNNYTDTNILKLINIVGVNKNNLPSLVALIKWPNRCTESFKIMLKHMPEDNSNIDMTYLINYSITNKKYNNILKLLHQRYSKSFGVVNTNNIYIKLKSYYQEILKYDDPDDEYLINLSEIVTYFKSQYTDT
jgi:hypothetical protein